MRKHRATLLVASALIAGTLGVGASSASAAACSTVGCFNVKIGKLTRKVNTLTRHLAQDEAKIASLSTAQSCFRRVPVTQYGDPFGSFGYVFNSAFYTSALDFTESGDPNVSAYFVRDVCGSIPVGRITRTAARK